MKYFNFKFFTLTLVVLFTSLVFLTGCTGEEEVVTLDDTLLSVGDEEEVKPEPIEEEEEVKPEPIEEVDIEITPEEFLKIEKVVNPEYDSSVTLEAEKIVGSYVLINKGTVGGLVGETGILKKVDGEWTIKLSFLHNWFERSCDELCQADVPLELILDASGISRSFEFCGDIPYDEYCEINN